MSFREIVVSLLSHQVLLQNLYDILLEELARGPSPGEDKPPEARLAGFLRYLSMQNLAVVFDLLLDSYRTAREFDASPGLKSLLRKVSGVGGAANLHRQSAMSFNLYFHALLCALLSLPEPPTAAQVRRALFEDEEPPRSSDSSAQCSSEDEDIFEETAQVSPPRGKEQRRRRARLPSLSVQPASNADWAWLAKRLHKLCLEMCTHYLQLHLDLEGCLQEAPRLQSGDPAFFVLPAFQSESSTPSTSGGFSGKDTPSEDERSSSNSQFLFLREHPGEPAGLRGGGGGGGDLLLLPSSPKGERKEAGRRKEWWEHAGSRICTLAADKTISKLVSEYKRRRQQQQQQQETKGEKKGDQAPGPRGQNSPLLQRPQHLVDQGQMRHSFSAGPELLRPEKRPRSGSTGSNLSISVRDAEAQIQVGASQQAGQGGLAGVQGLGSPLGACTPMLRWEKTRCHAGPPKSKKA